MGKLVSNRNLKQPVGLLLSDDWKAALILAITKGNQIHDGLFDFEAVDIDIDDAVIMTGDQWGVDRIVSQVDVFGPNPTAQLKSVFRNACGNHSNKCYILTAHGRTFLLITFENESAMLIDSNSHKESGALIAYSQQGHVETLAEWLISMMKENWDCLLTIASIVWVHFK